MSTPRSTPARRDVLLALAVAEAVPRPVAYRLAAKIAEWEALGYAAGRAAALALGVPPGALGEARALLPGAPALARSALAAARRAGDRIVTLADPGYPPPLRELDLPPAALWIRGALPEADARTVAMVGSRRADPYAREAAELFGRELAAAGFTVVSGFARGVDAAAHRGALSAETGAAASGGCATVAVLGTGLGADYPRGHRRLAAEIAQRGALVSEFPPGSAPLAWRFPVRNRIIAALAEGVLVVRAAMRSGSLITARFALDLGRDVFAVPGRIFEERAMGTNALIADGAYPALHPRDVIEVLGPPAGGEPGAGREGPEPTPAPAGFRGRLLAALAVADPTPPEALATRIGEPVERVLGTLLELELEGRVRRYPGPAYVRRPQ